MTEVQGEQQQLTREEKQRDLLDGMDEDLGTKDTPVGKLNFSEPKKLAIKTKINPVLASMLKRQSATASSVHPQPQAGPEHGHIQLNKAERQELASSSSRSLLQSQQSDDMTKKHVATVFSLVFIPVMLTFYRAYYANDGPTRFSFHPMMMGVSLFSMLTAMLCQRLGGGQNITLVGSLSFASMLSLLVGVYAVWSTKELYGKPHFLTMHSHFGGMTIFGILCYGLAAYWVFNPWKGVARKNEKIQSYLITTGKIVAGVALTTMSAGIFEIERTWTFLVLWMASLLLVIPFLILS